MGPAFLPDTLWLARGIVLLDTYEFLDHRPWGSLDETGANPPLQLRTAPFAAPDTQPGLRPSSQAPWCCQYCPGLVTASSATGS